MSRLRTLTFAAIMLVATGSTTAFAGPALVGGFSLDPDDIVIGARWQGEPIAENLYFVPSAEIGFGDATMIAGNADLHYKFNTVSKLKPYAGGGVTINWFEDNGDSETDVGGSILGGIQLSPNLFLEAKLGLGDVPDWKFMVGRVWP